MADILPFERRKPATKRSSSRRGDTLCRQGHHKWEVDVAQRFDVKQGKLVTRYRCVRCGKTKVKAQ